MNFGDRVADAVERKQSCLCVGLDPRIDLLPPEVITGLHPGASGRARAYERFCSGVIDAVAEEAVAVKPQVAFFEALGGVGISALERVCAHARDAGLLVIVDAKRGDIASTAEAYAQAWLHRRDGAAPVGDAVTLNAYMGADSIAPFLATCGEGSGLFILTRTSNPGGADVQEAELEGGELVWERIASLVARWGEHHVGESGLSAVGAVVGATQPEAVARARELMPHAVLLLPGVGAQGGRPEVLHAATATHPAATRKGDGTWVTEADVAAEQAIRDRLSEARPDDNMLGEEDGLHAAGGGDAVPGAPTWVVDPIDGTHSYMVGIPLWATLVGLVVDGTAVVGVCHAPGVGETYEATAGGGARMNGESIAVRATPLAEAMVVSGGLRSAQEAGVERFYRDLSAAAWRVRGLGDFWGHMLVARGAAQIMVDPIVHTWDTTAVEVIVREAGGTITQIDGSPIADGRSCLSTCGSPLHDEVVALAARA